MRLSDISPSSIEAQHRKNKLHAVERLLLLFDEGECEELTTPEGRDGVYVCAGKVNGRPVVAVSQDFTDRGGSLGIKQGRNIVMALNYAYRHHCLFLCINDSGGARIQEGIDALAGYGEVFFQQVKLSGIVPQIAVIAGPCAGGAAYMPALSDFVFGIQDIGQLFLTGPAVVEQATGQKIDAEQLGGVRMHATQSGVVHFWEETEELCFAKVRMMIDQIPMNVKHDDAWQAYSALAPKHNLSTFKLPEREKRPFPIREILNAILDPESFIEVHREFAQQAIVGFARIAGIRVGMIANNTAIMAGALDCDSSDKIARFVRFCDCVRLPVITLTDVPGFLPGDSQETKGVIRHGAKILYAFSEATVPKINVVLRNAYGGAYIAMNSIHLGADRVMAWENSRIAVMGESAAVAVLERKTLRDMAPAEQQAHIAYAVEKYRKEVCDCKIALDKQFVQKIILPQDTRRELISALLELRHKKHGKMHGNIPV